MASRAMAGEERPGVEPQPMPLDVRYEDADLLVVNKPAGTLVHPVGPEQRDTLANGLAHYFRQQGLDARIHLVHRLDRDTSGLLVVAKSPLVHRWLDRQLRARTLRREYLALVRGVVLEDDGLIDAPIGRDADDPPLRTVRPDGAPARTRFRVVERYPAATLLRLELESGRTHQIRVHLAHAAHPVLGDRWYGRAGLELIGRQALHAAALSARHPVTSAPLRVEAPLPPDMLRLRERLRDEPESA